MESELILLLCIMMFLSPEFQVNADQVWFTALAARQMTNKIPIEIVSARTPASPTFLLSIEGINDDPP